MSEAEMKLKEGYYTIENMQSGPEEVSGPRRIKIT